MVLLMIPCVRKSAKNQSSGSRSRACACHRLGKSAGWRFNEYPNVSRCVSSMRCRLTASTSACRYLSSSNMPRDDVNASNTVCEAGVTVVFHVTPCLTRLRVGVAMQVLRLVYVPMWLSSNTVAPPQVGVRLRVGQCARIWSDPSRCFRHRRCRGTPSQPRLKRRRARGMTCGRRAARRMIARQTASFTYCVRFT